MGLVNLPNELLFSALPHRHLRIPHNVMLKLAAVYQRAIKISFLTLNAKKATFLVLAWPQRGEHTSLLTHPYFFFETQLTYYLFSFRVFSEFLNPPHLSLFLKSFGLYLLYCGKEMAFHRLEFTCYVILNKFQLPFRQGLVNDW